MRISPITSYQPVKQHNHATKVQPTFNGKWGLSLGAIGGAGYGSMAAYTLGSIMAVATGPIILGAATVGAVAGHIIEKVIYDGNDENNKK